MSEGRRVERLVKLTRSGAGGLWHSTGVEFRPLDHDEHVRLLRQKLIEEVGEYVTNPSIAELADVLEVAEALAEVDLGASWREVRTLQFDRRLDRGDFITPLAMYLTGTLNEGAEPDDQATVFDD